MRPAGGERMQFDRLNRREFITLLGGAAAIPFVAHAQQSERMRSIGVLLPASPNDPVFQARLAAFHQELALLGWIIGRNVRIDTRWATTNPDEIRRNATELVALAPDVILSTGDSTVPPLLIDYAKANPGTINTSSPGVGSISHLAIELFKMMAGVNLVHVPFGGNAPALTALLGGQVDLSVASLPSSIESIRSGKLHGVAVTTAMRAEAIPDVPALGEFVPGYEVSAWYGIGAPNGTPAEVIDKLN